MLFLWFHRLKGILIFILFFFSLECRFLSFSDSLLINILIMPPRTHINLEHPQSLIKLIDSHHKKRQHNTRNKHNINQKNPSQIITSSNFLTNSKIQFNNISVQIKNNNDTFDNNIEIIEKIVLKWSYCKQIYQ